VGVGVSILAGGTGFDHSHKADSYSPVAGWRGSGSLRQPSEATIEATADPELADTCIDLTDTPAGCSR